MTIQRGDVIQAHLNVHMDGEMTLITHVYTSALVQLPGTVSEITQQICVLFYVHQDHLLIISQELVFVWQPVQEAMITMVIQQAHMTLMGIPKQDDVFNTVSLQIPMQTGKLTNVKLDVQEMMMSMIKPHILIHTLTDVSFLLLVRKLQINYMEKIELDNALIVAILMQQSLSGPIISPEVASLNVIILITLVAMLMTPDSMEIYPLAFPYVSLSVHLHQDYLAKISLISAFRNVQTLHLEIKLEIEVVFQFAMKKMISYITHNSLKEYVLTIVKMAHLLIGTIDIVRLSLLIVQLFSMQMMGTIHV